MARNSIMAIPRREVTGNNLTGFYQLLTGVGGLGAPCFCITINNNSTREIDISYDGVTDHDFAYVGQVLTYPFQSQSQPQGFVAKFPSNMQIWIRGTAGGAGAIYLTGYYQEA